MYYERSDQTGKLPGYHCVRVPPAAGVGNSELFRLIKILLKFSDGLPIP